MDTGAKTTDLRNSDYLKRFLYILIPFLMVFLVAGTAHFLVQQHTGKLKRETEEFYHVGIARNILNNELSAVVTDLHFLVDYLAHLDAPLSPAKIDNIRQIFLSFSSQKKLFDQIRLLDNAGHERIRVNLINNQSLLVDDSKLQNKSDRYYYREGMKLENGAIYISPMDLNIEHGQVERPYKPVMRFVMKVHDKNNQAIGLLVLNYLGERMLQQFRQAGSQVAESLYLLNDQGYSLSSPNSAEDWGFMLKHGKRFSDHQPEAWRIISKGVAGQFRTSHALYTYETVTPRNVADQISGVKLQNYFNMTLPYRMKVVAIVHELKGTAALSRFLHEHVLTYLTIFSVILISSALISRANLKHHRAELQNEYERRFRRTLEEIEMVALMINRSGKIEFCNDYFLRLCHWKKSEVIGHDWITTLFREPVSDNMQQLLDCAIEHQPFIHDQEAPLLTSAGNSLLIDWHMTATRDANNQVRGITCLGEDITEKKQAEEEVRKLFRAVEQSPSIVMLTNRKGLIEYVNPKFVEVTGYSREEVIGKNPKLLKSGETSSEDYQSLWQAIKKGGEWRGEFHNRRKNGEMYWESASISGLRGADGEITHYIAVKEDITQRKQLQQEVEQRKRELARSETLASMGRMASMIAHDLRNPLSSVKMTVQILGKQADATSAELSSIALQQIRHMETIITDTLAFARPEKVNTEWLDIHKVIDASLQGLQKSIAASNITISTDYEQGLPTTPGDPVKLRQVFENLINNAITATLKNDEHQRHLTILARTHLSPTGTSVRISFCDNGEGLEGKDIDKLFEPFYTTSSNGTGLGLAICHQILQQHGGSIRLQPNHKQGSCVLVTLATSPQQT